MRVGKAAFGVLLVLSVGLGGCPSQPAYQPIPVEEARNLNTRLRVFYEETRDIIETSAFSVSQVGNLPGNIRPQDFEIALVRTALQRCFNDSLAVTTVTVSAPRAVQAEVSSDRLRPLTARGNLGTVRPCAPSDLISLESYLDVTPGHIREFIIDRVLQVDTLRVNLKHVVQERLNLLEEYALQTRGDLARLRDSARERYENTLASREVSEEQRRQTEADYEVIQDLFDQIDGLIEAVEGELAEMRRFRRQLVEDVSVAVAAMGTPRS
jgi:hypothetical protein